MLKSKPYFSSDFKLGILGGGQLGKMLLSETRRYDIYTKVMDASAEAPGRIAANKFVVGSLTDKKAVLDFAKGCDVLTIEIENVNTEALHELEQGGMKVFPKPGVLDIIKNKVVQKGFYVKNEIPTAPYFSFKNSEERDQLIAEKGIKPPFVWKAATGGYDGRGVQVVKTKEDIQSLPDVEGLIEDMIDFEAEIAVVTARSESGEIKSMPIVEMEFHPQGNFVKYVFSPSSLSQKIHYKAEVLAEQVVKQLDHVGLLAVEMFLTKGGELLINEVAPRVHNSGHLSIEGNVTSQFDQHLRAILNLPLGDMNSRKASVMVNLTGEDGYDGPVYYKGIEKVMAMPGVYVHLYGKTHTRPFRKMGHITICADTMAIAKNIARRVKSSIKVISR